MSFSFTTIDKLLLKEISKNLLIILSVLIALVFSNFFVKILAQVASGDVEHDLIFIFAGVYILKTLGLIIPPAFFLSIILVLGRMYRDGEITALEAAGVGPLRLYRSFLFTTVPLAIFVTWLVFFILPIGKAYIDELETAGDKDVSFAIFQAGKFIETNRGGLVVYSETITDDGLGLHNVFVQDRQNSQLGLVVSKDAYQRTDPVTGDRFVVLLDGKRFQGTPGTLDYSIGDFEEYAFKLSDTEEEKVTAKLSAKSSLELWQSDSIHDRSEWQYRLSFPLAIFAFMFISLPLAKSLPRQGVYSRLVIAFFIYFVFSNLQRVAKNLMVDGVTPSWIGTWWLPILMGLIAYSIIYYDRLNFERRIPSLKRLFR